jgi:hypothetical protein
MKSLQVIGVPACMIESDLSLDNWVILAELTAHQAAQAGISKSSQDRGTHLDVLLLSGGNEVSGAL